ncbi:hypothetical protein Tco_1566695, partial [Tanacetum coccineum]
IVMSDSEDSTVTYTEVSSPFEDMSDIGSPGYQSVTSPNWITGMSDIGSPDYVSGPEYPPSHVYVPYVPEPVYP